jgi:hypothetical protein
MAYGHSHASLRHILPALEMLRISLFGPPNRRKQPERYVQYGPKIFKNLLTNFYFIVYNKRQEFL